MCKRLLNMRIFIAAALTATCYTGSASAMSLEQAIRIAIDSNPEIGAAVANRKALDFELRQAEGLFLPSVDFEGRSGAGQLNSPSTRSARTSGDVLHKNEANLIVSQLLFDGWESRGEVERQAARVDGAAARIFERSEFIGLNVARQFIEIGRLMRVVRAARRNIAYHKSTLSSIRKGARSGAVTVADRQQAEERLFAAEARLVEFSEELNSARIRFRRLVGEPLKNYRAVRRVGRHLPSSLSGALGIARTSNPTIKIAKTGVDSATALIKKATSEFYPKVTIEGTAKAADNLDGVKGYQQDLRAELVVKWNLYRGGIDSANRQEQINRVDEERQRLHQIHRDVEEAVRLSWETRNKQRRRLARLRRQLSRANVLINSYQEQFKIGGRSLLDLLDTQNTRFSTQVAVDTAEAAYIFAEYRLLASMGVLLETLGLEAQTPSIGNARKEVNAPPTPPAETQKRWTAKVIGVSNWQTRVRREN